LERNAVLLTEHAYKNGALVMLDKAEAFLEEAESLMKQGKEAEGNLRFADAFIHYKQCRNEIDRFDRLLKPLGDNSILSSKGTNLATMRRNAESLNAAAGEGLVQIEEAERKTARDTAAEEAARAFDMIKKEYDELSSKMAEPRESYPFYDFPKAELENLKAELDAAGGKSLLIIAEIRDIENSLDTRQVFLRQKTAFLKQDAETLDVSIRDMMKAVEEEIRYPRLARQEDRRRSEERKKRLADSVKWFFFHKPCEYLTFRYDVPVVFDTDESWRGLDTFNAGVRLEGSFKPGVWLRSTLRHEEWNLGDGAFFRSLHQDVGLGFFGDTLWGIGYGWDWFRDVSRGSSDFDAVKHQRIKIFYGKMDHERHVPSIIGSAAYELPRYHDDFISVYHANIEVEVRIKAEDIVFVEGSFVSKSVQTGPGPASSLQENISHLIGWKAGVAFRLPYPFALGVGYQGGKTAPVDSEGNVEEYRSLPQGWTFFIEYSF
jgi:hypothetical protein